LKTWVFRLLAVTFAPTLATLVGNMACGGELITVPGDEGDDGGSRTDSAFADAPRPSDGATDGVIGSDSGFDGITPPSAPSGPPTSATTPANFAVHELFLGDTDFSGKADPNAWKEFGYNIDGKITTATSTNVCKLHDGGGSFGAGVQADGNGGIDNSFGENIFAGILLMVDATLSTNINEEITGGAFTVMFDVTGLDPTSTQTATGLSAQLFTGGKFPGTPTFTTADDWPVLPGGLSSTTPPFVSTQQFPDAYVVNGTWVSGPPGDVTLGLPIDGYSLPLIIHQAVVTFEHSTAIHGANGQISGVLDTTEFVAGFRNLAGSLSKSLCSGAALTGILAEIEDAQDVLSDGTNPEGMPCNAISIGLGFTADAIAQPDMLAPAITMPDPCGTDGG
jgi:hypothetical protein